MSSNVGTVDRLVRLLFASILLYLGLIVYSSSLLGIAFDIAAAILGLTGLFGFCGLYALLGMNTCQRPNSN
ncbi:MAG: hypothetical protein B0A82_26010 [Alkalinema sp. CACIAM 70d]|nr:MAG: hypothetical protein B0A82_26010 [Alkalinema sp. CACIAM 70d]